MKRKLLTMLALLCLTVTGAWALDPISGNCGATGHESDVTYTLSDENSDGTYDKLSITKVGETGAMADYISSTAVPWKEDRSNITSISIGSGVTHIGNMAFNNIAKATSVDIPASVTSIGESAFSGCYELTTITIPDGVTTIGREAFWTCYKLTSVTIPANVTSIGVGIFSSCTSLGTISVDAENTKYDSREGCNAIIEKASNKLVAGCKNTVIPTDVTSIENKAFYGLTGLTSITIPTGVTSIGESAFENCTSMTSITFNSGLTTIRTSAFQGCNKLESVTLPASVTNIGPNAFLLCSKLATVTLNSNPIIWSSAFSNVKSDAMVTMNLAANSVDGTYWTTFYNRNHNFQVPAGTQIFKAALSGSALTLTELETDKIITKDNAVILKSTTGPFSLTLTTTDSSNDFTGNSLEGVDIEAGVSSSGSIYVLNYKAETGVGFYKLASGKKVGLGKAYLYYNGALAPEFFGFDVATGVDVPTGIDIPTAEANDADAEVYDLQGRRVAHATKGLYIVNGKKVIIK